MARKIASRKGKKKNKRKTCIICFPMSPLFTMLLLPFSVSHSAFKSWFTFIHKQSRLGFFMPVYVFHDFMPKNMHTSLAKVHGHPAQLGIISANKVSSEAKGCPGCPRNAGLALGCLDYLPVFAQHWMQSHYSFRKAFHIPGAKKHQKLLHKSMCRQCNGDRLSLCSQTLKATFCRYICIPLENFIAVYSC